MKKYNQFISEEVYSDFDFGGDRKLVNPFQNPFQGMTEEELHKIEHQILGREGKLSEHIRSEGGVFTFGMLKAIYKDALEHKRRREFKKGSFKLLHRAIPMIVAQIFLPLSFLALALGASRALDKIAIPILRDPHNNYPQFLRDFLINSINLLEGDYRMFMPRDWFYNIFAIDEGLKKLVRKEHLIDFAATLSKIMSNKPDDEEVPREYVQNEFRKYIKQRFKVSIRQDIRPGRGEE